MAQPSVTTSIYQNRAQITFYPGPHKYSVRVPGVVEKLFQPSITGILSQKNKGALLGWAAKESLAVVRRRLGEYQSEMGELTPIPALDAAGLRELADAARRATLPGQIGRTRGQEAA